MHGMHIAVINLTVEKKEKLYKVATQIVDILNVNLVTTSEFMFIGNIIIEMQQEEHLNNCPECRAEQTERVRQSEGSDKSKEN